MLLDEERASARCQKLGGYSSLKALEILETLSHSRSYVGITELSAVTGLSASTVHRILQELMDTGYVAKNEDRKYRLGFDAMALGMRMQASDFMVEAAKGEMQRLNDLSTETIHLIALNQYQGIYIAKLEAKNQIGLRSRVGWSLPLHCTGGGKAVLANQEPEWLRAYLKNEPRKRFTERTFVEEGALLEELERIRSQGYALDNREHHADVVCVAAPIFSADGKALCAIGISAPDYRFPLDKAISLADEVMASAAAVSRRLRQC